MKKHLFLFILFYFIRTLQDRNCASIDIRNQEEEKSRTENTNMKEVPEFLL